MHAWEYGIPNKIKIIDMIRYTMNAFDKPRFRDSKIKRSVHTLLPLPQKMITSYFLTTLVLICPILHNQTFNFIQFSDKKRVYQGQAERRDNEGRATGRRISMKTSLRIRITWRPGTPGGVACWGSGSIPS